MQLPIDCRAIDFGRSKPAPVDVPHFVFLLVLGSSACTSSRQRKGTRAYLDLRQVELLRPKALVLQVAPEANLEASTARMEEPHKFLVHLLHHSESEQLLHHSETMTTPALPTTPSPSRFPCPAIVSELVRCWMLSRSLAFCLVSSCVSSRVVSRCGLVLPLL